MSARDVVIRGAGVVVVAGVLIGGGSYVVGGGGGADTANAFVNTSVVGDTCTRSSSPVTFAAAEAANQLCGTFDAAWDVASSGDTIRVKSGSYGNQAITGNKTSTTYIIAEDSTTIGELTTNGDFLEIQNVDATFWGISTAGVNDVTGRDIRVTGNDGVYWNAEGYSNVSWIGGSMKNFSCSCAAGFAIFAGDTVTGTAVASNILVDGVEFDNIDNSGGAGNHFEALRVDGKVQGLTIKNSSITNSTVTSSLIFFSAFRGSKPTDILLENNFFGTTTDAFYTLNVNFLGASCANWTLRYNTFQVPAMAGGNCSYSAFAWVGNLAPTSSCEGNTFTDNVYYGVGSTCSASDLVIASSGLGGDGFHLQSGSGAIDTGGSGGNCIATDHDGGPRPVGVQCDAGADERD